MRQRLWQVVVMICVLLFGSWACLGLVWRRQQTRFYRAQYEAAEALRRSETKFRTLYDTTRDAVMLLDGKGFFDCNQATLTMFGCATGRSSARNIPPMYRRRRNRTARIPVRGPTKGSPQR